MEASNWWAVGVETAEGIRGVHYVEVPDRLVNKAAWAMAHEEERGLRALWAREWYPT